MENWGQEYNNYRTHSSLDYLAPAEFARRYCENMQAEATRQSWKMAGTLIVGDIKNGGTPTGHSLGWCIPWATLSYCSPPNRQLCLEIG